MQKLCKSLLKFCTSRRIPIILFVLVLIIFRWFSNVYLESSMMPSCFWYIDWITFALLNIKGGWGSFFVLRLKMTSWVCLVDSGLRFIFHWKTQLSIISKSLLRLFSEVWLSWITENKDVSSANNLAFVESPSERSLILIKNNNGLRMEPWGTPGMTFSSLETWPFENYAFSSLT